MQEWRAGSASRKVEEISKLGHWLKANAL